MWQITIRCTITLLSTNVSIYDDQIIFHKFIHSNWLPNLEIKLFNVECLEMFRFTPSLSYNIGHYYDLQAYNFKINSAPQKYSSI